MARLCPVCGCQLQQRYTSNAASMNVGQNFCPQCNALVIDADFVDPIYCRYCHQPRLRFALSSEGYCNPCLLQMQQQRQAQEAEKLRQEEALRKAQEAQKQAVFNKDTGRGFCPQCGSRNIQELTVDMGGGSPEGAQEAACCGMPLLLAGALSGAVPGQTWSEGDASAMRRLRVALEDIDGTTHHAG